MSKSSWAMLLFIGALLVVQLVIGFGKYVEGERNEIRREAVRLGHAEYVHDEHGNPVFRWKEVEHEAE